MSTLLRHPDDATLISYASGALSQVISLVTAAHLERCPQCRARLRQAEQIGGVLVQQPVSRVVSLRGRAAMLERLDETMPTHAIGADPMYAANEDPDMLPLSVQPYFGKHLSELKWKTLIPGVQRVQAQGIEQGNLMLLKIAAGMSMPVHNHEGSEMTMVLKGAYHDELGEYRVGDIADLDSDVQHQPVAFDDQGCICLAASDSPLRFHGLLARMLQPLFKI